MDEKHINLNRAHPSSEQIQDRQDFNYVLENALLMRPKRTNRPLFYGAIGLSTISLLIGISFILLTKKNDKKNTLTTTHFISQHDKKISQE
jgi:hypothetical protein